MNLPRAVCSLLRAACRFPLAACRLLLAAGTCRWPLATGCLPLAACRLPFAACRLPLAACRSPPAATCLLRAVCCSLRAACCLPLATEISSHAGSTAFWLQRTSDQACRAENSSERRFSSRSIWIAQNLERFPQIVNRMEPFSTPCRPHRRRIPKVFRLKRAPDQASRAEKMSEGSRSEFPEPIPIEFPRRSGPEPGFLEVFQSPEPGDT